MQIKCPNCNHVAQVDDAKIPEKAMLAKCPKCLARFLFEKATAMTSSQPDKEVFRCPKCNAEQDRSEMCQHCGLIFEKYFRTEAAERGQAPAGDRHGGYESSSYRSNKTGGQKIKMVSIGKYLWIFAAGYIGLMIGAGVVLNYLGIKHGSGVNTGIFIGTAFFSLNIFVKDHGRLWEIQEKWKLIMGFILVSSGYDLLLVLLFAFPKHSGISTFLFAMFFGVVFVNALRLLGLCVFMGPMANRIFGNST